MNVIGVSFRHQCKTYLFDSGDLRISRDQHVIVETGQGLAYADVTMPTMEMREEDAPKDLKPVIRIATPDDDDQQALNEKNEITAVRICKQKVKQHEKEMKIIRAMYAFDRSKLTFYFTADGRVDFVALVKDLAREFRTRIELRQVGARDETRLLGGIGACGRELCCATWLTDFVQIPIKAAKEQNLSLNAAKISGFCGRLMCCLKHEEETYQYLNSKLPNMNQRVKTKDGERGIVKGLNPLLQKVTVEFSEGEGEDRTSELRVYSVEDLRFEPRHSKEDSDESGDQPKEQKKNRPAGEKKNGRPQERKGDGSSREKNNDRPSGDRKDSRPAEDRNAQPASEKRENGDPNTKRENGDPAAKRENGEASGNNEPRKKKHKYFKKKRNPSSESGNGGGQKGGE